jgi:hypothetical protein
MSGEKKYFEARSLYGIISKENQFKIFESQHESAPPILFKQLLLDPSERILNIMPAIGSDGKIKMVFLTQRQLLSFVLKSDHQRGTMFLIEPKVFKVPNADFVDFI